jgi:hypothetical protein
MAAKAYGIRLGSSPSVSNDLKLRKKEKILSILNRLNDRDTQKAAAEELLALIAVSIRQS